jgi:hypothetical protein
MFNRLKEVIHHRDGVRDFLIEYAVGFFKQHPEVDIKVAELQVMAADVARRAHENSLEDMDSAAMAHGLTLAVQNFSSVTWLYIATEIAKQTGKASIFDQDGQRMELRSMKQGDAAVSQAKPPPTRKGRLSQRKVPAPLGWSEAERLQKRFWFIVIIGSAVFLAALLQ